jgi:2-keto-4-pentenoate hydratase/2-oxohepta-3-ene-1,7-dioic acid hydratase in catechol pathway
MAGRTPDKEPQFFFKAHSTLVGPEDPIVLPWMSEEVVHEPELAIVIGTRAKNVSVDRALGHVLGYTCANDVTARDFQQKDRLATGRTKNFDTFCPLGPLIVSALDPEDLEVCARINGRLGCCGRTSQLIWTVPELVSFLSCVMTLLPGDVVLTAAPGIDALHPGDVAEVEIEGIGVLRNPVVASKDRPVRWQWP